MTSRLTMAIPLTEGRQWLQLIRQTVLGSAVLALVTLVGFELRLPYPAVGFIYLIVIVVASLIHGIWQATVLSLVAVSCLNYFFIPPIFSLIVSDERDWVALVSFQTAALLVSQISSREQRMARDANYQRIQMKKLYELCRAILLLDLHSPPGPQLTHIIRRTFLLNEVAVYDANLDRLDHEGDWTPDEQQAAKAGYLEENNEDDPGTRTTQRVIRSGSESIGALAIQGEMDPLIANSIASLAAIAFERYRSYENEALAESAKHAEELRVAVLDALAHAFKTPLTAICTAASGLLEVDSLDRSEADLVGLINEEAVNLNQLCTQLLQTARLESSSMAPSTEPVIVSKLVRDVLSTMAGTLKGHNVELAIDERDAPLDCDRGLLAMVLTQYLDNAAKYSDPSTPIGVAVRENDAELLVSVKNRGPVIPVRDRDRIFERFYRGAGAKEHAPGTGVGLSIVKKAAEAQKGHVWVISTLEEGTTFFLSMPKTPVGEARWNPA